MERYDIIAPEGPCVDNDPHDLILDMVLCSPIPGTVYCPRCGKVGTVVVFSEDPI